VDRASGCEFCHNTARQYFSSRLFQDILDCCNVDMTAEEFLEDVGMDKYLRGGEDDGKCTAEDTDF
jgi:hypothetical protein